VNTGISELLQYIVLISNAPIVAGCLVFLWRLDRRMLTLEVTLGVFPNRREKKGD